MVAPPLEYHSILQNARKNPEISFFVFCEMRPAGFVLCAGAGWYEGQKFYLVFSLNVSGVFQMVPQNATKTVTFWANFGS